MLEVNISFQLNMSREEKKQFPIDMNAISNFLDDGFSENIYSGTVNLQFNSRYDEPKIIEIIISIYGILENLEVITNELKFLLNKLNVFLNNHKNHEAVIIVETKTNKIVETIKNDKKIIEKTNIVERRIEINKDISEDGLIEILKEL